ncbi:LLM class flavin-dependent oxidoreductase [Neptunicella marina]|uniref:Luciferase-like monooxygenase n=1 Tax=Neptunicella marina TaxID=2125989 RepID=A0A8J6LYN1_9ALTE|nr:LLM class flavin-dependent oxidoreductase [Neptunicella marina]MBC3766239.1 LLM class flavin-dependent oxidoreductase [Neptunicella marina]
MIPLSVLDLAPITENHSLSDTIEHSRQLAIAAEQHNYQRFWLAEHHGMRGVASSATALMISQVGAVTKKIRIGAGGIMLPNHPPLVIAEQFGTLEALFPGRVDLGLGRAPGSDMATIRALRRDMHSQVDTYPDDIRELQRYLAEEQANQQVIAMPGQNSKVPLWLLGSSLYSAQQAARMGLPFAFASHFAPDMLQDAISLYRSQFVPSAQQDKPYVIGGVMAVVADSDEEAEFLSSSIKQQFVNLQRGDNKPFSAPVADINSVAAPHELHRVNHTLKFSLIGDKAKVKDKLERFVKATGVDEVIASFPLYDIEKRLNSLRLLADCQ